MAQSLNPLIIYCNQPKHLTNQSINQSINSAHPVKQTKQAVHRHTAQQLRQAPCLDHAVCCQQGDAGAVRTQQGAAQDVASLQAQLQAARSMLDSAEHTKRALTGQVGHFPEGFNPWSSSAAQRRALIP